MDDVVAQLIAERNRAQDVVEEMAAVYFRETQRPQPEFFARISDVLLERNARLAAEKADGIVASVPPTPLSMIQQRVWNGNLKERLVAALTDEPQSTKELTRLVGGQQQSVSATLCKLATAGVITRTGYSQYVRKPDAAPMVDKRRRPNPFSTHAECAHG